VLARWGRTCLAHVADAHGPESGRTKSLYFRFRATLFTIGLAYVLQEYAVNRVILPLLIRASSGGWRLGQCGLGMLQPYAAKALRQTRYAHMIGLLTGRLLLELSDTSRKGR
jgi:hypothetical protein